MRTTSRRRQAYKISDHRSTQASLGSHSPQPVHGVTHKMLSTRHLLIASILSRRQFNMSAHSNVESIELATPSAVSFHTDERIIDPSDSTESHGVQHHHQLEPTDRGFAAWKLLLTAFIFEALLWGDTNFRSHIRSVNG